jgi:hypothetical protein
MLNIAYTFAPEDEAKLTKISTLLNCYADSEYRLGNNSIAHVSIVHINADEADVEQMWQKLQNSTVEMDVELVLKNFVVEAPWKGRVYSNFSLERVGELSKVQKNIMRLFKGIEVFNGCGSEFYPHLTTSCHLDVLKAHKLPAQKPPFRRFQGFLTIGTRDSYGRMEKVLLGGYKG